MKYNLHLPVGLARLIGTDVVMESTFDKISVVISDMKDVILSRKGYVLTRSQTRRQKAYEIEPGVDYKLRVVGELRGEITLCLVPDYYDKKCTHSDIPIPCLIIQPEQDVGKYSFEVKTTDLLSEDSFEFEYLFPEEKLIFRIITTRSTCKSCETFWLRCDSAEYCEDGTGFYGGDICVPFVLKAHDK